MLKSIHSNYIVSVYSTTASPSSYMDSVKWTSSSIQSLIHSSTWIFHSSSTTSQSNFLCSNVCNIQSWQEKSFFFPPLSSFTLTDLMLHSHNHLQCVYITIDSSLSTSHKKKWNCYVFVYNSLLEIHGFFQGDKRTEVSTSSVKGDVWSNVKAVLIFLNCVCSVCHY